MKKSINEFENEIRLAIAEKRHIGKNDPIGQILGDFDATSDVRHMKSIFVERFIYEATNKVQQLIEDENNALDRLRLDLRLELDRLDSTLKIKFKHFQLRSGYRSMDAFLGLLSEPYYKEEYHYWRNLFPNAIQVDFFQRLNRELDRLCHAKTVMEIFRLEEKILAVFEDVDIPFELYRHFSEQFLSLPNNSALNTLLNAFEHLPDKLAADVEENSAWQSCLEVVHNISISPKAPTKIPQWLHDTLTYIAQRPQVIPSSDGSIVNVHGFRYRTSQLKLEELLGTASRIKFFAFAVVHLDSGFAQELWHGKNVEFIAKKVRVDDRVIINLSGNNGANGETLEAAKSLGNHLLPLERGLHCSL